MPIRDVASFEYEFAKQSTNTFINALYLTITLRVIRRCTRLFDMEHFAKALEKPRLELRALIGIDAFRDPVNCNSALDVRVYYNFGGHVWERQSFRPSSERIDKGEQI